MQSHLPADDLSIYTFHLLDISIPIGSILDPTFYTTYCLRDIIFLLPAFKLMHASPACLDLAADSQS